MEIGEPLKVSIITVVLNGAAHIEQTIQSVLHQSYPNIEYILVDGVSTDGTIDIIRKYENEIALFISEKDEGISDAFNKGIVNATGKIVGIINSDDWYETDAIMNVVTEYSRFPYYDVLYGQCGIIQTIGTSVNTPRGSSHVKLNKSMCIAHPSVFATRDAYKRYGVFNKQYRIAMDYDWLLGLCVAGACFKYIPSKLANHRAGGLSYTQSALGKEECKEIRKKYLLKQRADTLTIV